MENLKIKTKFILLGTIGTLTSMYIVLLAINMSKLGLQSIDTIYQDSKKVQKIQQDFIATIYNFRELSLSLVTAPNDDFIKEINKKLYPLIPFLDEKFKLLDPILNKQWEDYKKLHLITQNFIKEGFEEGAFLNVNQEEREQFYKLINSLLQLQNKKLIKSYNTFKKTKKTISENRFFILFISISLGLFIALLAWIIISRIINDIQKLKLGLNNFFYFLKHKNSKKQIEIKLNSKDEIGDMAQSINKQILDAKIDLKEDLQVIKSATKMLNELKEGNLETRITQKANSQELNILRNLINEMVDNLEAKIQEEINKRTNQEKLLIQQSKLAEMGNMIENIAHQWRQPLSEINAILMNLETRYKFNNFNEKSIEESVKECNDITSYMSNTISDFQNFFKPSKTKENFDVIEACKKASSILSPSLKNNNITFSCNYDNNQKKILGYPNEFSQAILNILNNAKDALIQRDIKNPFINVMIKSGKKFALIKIEDNAGGIKEENLEKIFEPYYTTKHLKQGTGIGLYMCKTIIENNMNGILNVKNTKEGACFTIKLKS